MSKGAKIIIAVGLGLLAALFGMLYLNSQRRLIEGGAALVEVYIAADDVGANIELTPDMLTTKLVPQAYLQPQVITKAEVPDPAGVKGVTLVPVREGEQIIRTKLWEGTEPPLAEDVPAGLVGVSVGFNTTPQSVAANVKPRDRVDILAALQFIKPPKEKFLEIRPMFYDVEIIAVDQRTPQTISRKFTQEGQIADEQIKVETVTVVLPPAEAQQLILAQELGQIWLILRGQGEYPDYRYETWNQDRFLQSQFRIWDEESMQAEMAEEMARELGRR